MSLLINHGKPVVASETLDEDQDNQKRLAKELIKLMRIQLIKDDESSFSCAP